MTQIWMSVSDWASTWLDGWPASSGLMDPLLAGEIRAGHRAFLNQLAPRSLEPNPLRIVTCALNGLFLKLCNIRQPCWRAGRWKSLT